MDNEITRQLIAELKQIMIEQALLIKAVENAVIDLTQIKKMLYGNGAAGLKTEVLLIKKQVELLHHINEKMEKYTKVEEQNRKSRFLTTIGIIVSISLGIASLIISL